MSSRSALLRALDSCAARLSGSPLPLRGEANPFAGLLPWELRTRAALDVPRQSNNDIFDLDYAAQLLEFAGVCTFRSAVSDETVGKCRVAANSLAASLRNSACTQGVDLDIQPDGFAFEGAYLRDPGRIDFRNHDTMLKPPFDARTLNEAAPWLPLICHVLGDSPRLLWKGLVIAEPGTREQSFHSDGPIVGHEVWQEYGLQYSGGVLPAHSLTVHVPLVDCGTDQSAGIGSTSFLPGSHHRLTAAALEAEALDAGCSAGAGIPASLNVQAGDAIVFDLRTHHAGGHNASTERRSVMYFVYARSWYNTALHRRLLTERGVV